MLNKKGAMFGLDARIALAIFGALSVISGAALYSAIQDARATALLADLNEVGKAWEQYMLDTGQDLPPSGTSAVALLQRNTAPLVESTLDGWQGPYLSYPKGSGNFLKHNMGTADNDILIISAENSQWLPSGDWRTDGLCTSDEDCGLWIHFNDMSNNSIRVSLDEKIDNGDGNLAGNVRWFDLPSRNYLVYYKYTSFKRP